jgi:heme exporter protein D
VSAIGASLAMGGYAAYVWPAYALAGVVLGGLTFHFWRRHRDSARSLERLQQYGRLRR